MTKDFIPIAGLYAICDNTPCPGRSHLSLAFQLLCGGARILQLRMKGAEHEQRREVARSLRALKRQFAFCFIINDDVELVREVGADGVHVGADDLSVSGCRRFLGPSRYVGYSAHTLAEALAAAAGGADYVAFGAIFPSPLKGPGHPIQGVRQLKKVVRMVPVPVVAIGGITSANVASVARTGVAAVAMISALTGAPDVIGATWEVVRQLQGQSA